MGSGEGKVYASLSLPLSRENVSDRHLACAVNINNLLIDWIVLLKLQHVWEVYLDLKFVLSLFYKWCNTTVENEISTSKRCFPETACFLRDFRSPKSLGFHLAVNMIVLARYTLCLHIVIPPHWSLWALHRRYLVSSDCCDKAWNQTCKRITRGRTEFIKCFVQAWKWLSIIKCISRKRREKSEKMYIT